MIQLLDLAISFGMPCIQGTGPRGHWRIPGRPTPAPGTEVGDVGDFGDPGDRDGDLGNGHGEWEIFMAILWDFMGFYGILWD